MSDVSSASCASMKLIEPEITWYSFVERVLQCLFHVGAKRVSPFSRWIRDHHRGVEFILYERLQRLEEPRLFDAGPQDPEHVALKRQHRQCQQAETSAQAVLYIFSAHFRSTGLVVLVRRHLSASFTLGKTFPGYFAGRVQREPSGSDLGSWLRRRCHAGWHDAVLSNHARIDQPHAYGARQRAGRSKQRVPQGQDSTLCR